MSDETKLPQGVTNEEWIEATNKVCLGGWDAGVGFFGRHPRIGFACATTIQCDLNKSRAQISALTAQVEEQDLEIAHWKQECDAYVQAAKDINEKLKKA